MRYIILNEQNKVIAWRTGPSIVEGEIESALGEVGQIMQQDGTFIDAPPEPETYEQARVRYIHLIQESQTLGEVDEVTRLQADWAQLKINNGW
jgi:hypothetical protein